MSDLGSRSFRLRVLLLLLVGGIAVAAPALKGEILGYDDASLLLGENGAFERSPGSFFTETYYYAYLPFYGLSYWVDGKVGGGSPVLVHLANALWHVGTGYLVYLLLARLLGGAVPALFGALVFLLHPLHVESVAWISGRKEVMSAFFLFLAWLLHLRREEGARGALAGALAAFLVAGFTKSTAIVLPGMLLVAALLLPRYEGRRRAAALATAPYFVLALLPLVVHLSVGLGAGVVREGVPLGERLLAGLWAWGTTVRHSLLPLGLSIDYPEGLALGAGQALLGGILLLAAVAALLLTRRRAPAVAFGVAAFLVALAPFNNVFPATTVRLADRYAYLSLFGLAVVVAWAVRRWREGGLAAAAASVVLCVLSMHSAARFTSDEVLWTRTIEARDGSAVAWLNRGLSRVGRAEGPPQDAALRAAGVADLEAAVHRAALPEHRLKALAALVIPLLKQGKAAEALERSRSAFDVAPDDDRPETRRFLAERLYDRGLVHESLGRHREAARDLAASRKLWPRFRTAYEEGLSWMHAGRAKEARAALSRAADLDRSTADPCIQLAVLERQLGDRERQKRALEEASRREPGSARVAEGWVMYWLGGRAPDYREARRALRDVPVESAERKRLEAQVEAQRAIFHLRRRELSEAVSAADRARALDLGRSPAQYELGQIYIGVGRYDDAVACFLRAADVLSERAAYRDAVARAYSLKAYGQWCAGDRIGAKRSVRAALDVQPEQIEAGAVPLRGEVAALRRAADDDLLLLAAAAVAGDPGRVARAAREVLAKESVTEADRALAYHLRGLSRAFVSYDFPGAEEDLTLVLARSPGDRWARFRLAQVRALSGAGWMRTADQLRSVERREQGRELVKDAIRLFGRLLDEDPDFHHARLQRGQAYFTLDDLVGAKSDYEYVRERAPAMKEVAVKEAVLHRLVYVQGGDRANLETAIRILTGSLELDPNYFDGLYELGNAYHLLYDRQEDTSADRRLAFHRAILWYRRAMSINPRAREPRLEWARICLKAAHEALGAGSPKAAHHLVLRVEEEAPDVVDAHKQRVRLNLRPDFRDATGMRPEAIFSGASKALEAIERLRPTDPELPALRSSYHRMRGYSFYWTWVKLKQKARKERARELAVEEWSKALEAWPGDPDNESVRDRLREIAPEAIQHDRKRAEAAYERAREAFDAGRYGEAADRFSEALALFPEWIDLRYAYAVALLRTRRLEQARAELERVANDEQGGRFPEALLELGNLYLSRGKKPVARAWYERYVKAMESAGRGDDSGVGRARELIEELE